MDLEINYDPKLDVVQVRYQGSLDSKTGRDIAKKAISVSLKKNCNKILCDFRNAPFKESVFEIYLHPPFVDETGNEYFRMSTAVVYATDRDAHMFWETVTANRGYRTKCFTDQEKAVRWLHGQVE